MPVKIGSKSETRWERSRRDPDLVGTKCPSCETVNPYTRFSCKSCGVSLRRDARKSGIAEKIWVFIGIGVLILVVVLAVAMGSGQ
jgi:uncharacterized OB-fold protein